MGALGLQELLIIFLVLAVLFGTAKLPKLGKALGESIREFRNVGRELINDKDDKEEK